MTVVSVVIPTHNRLHYLRHAVRSVLDQTMSDLEVIVVDDGCTDGTRSYVETLTDRRVRAVHLPVRSGNVAHGRNIGASIAGGQYLAFLDDDDLWLPTRLEVQVAEMQRASVRWSYSQFDHCDENGRPMATDLPAFWKSLSGRIASDIVNGRSMVALIGVLMERALFEELGGMDEDRRIAWRDDTDLVLRLAMNESTIAVSGVLAYIREHDGRTLRTIELAEHQLTKAAVFRKALTLASEPALRRSLRRQRGIRLAEAGAHHWRSRDWSSGAACFLRSAACVPPVRAWCSAIARGLGLWRWPHDAYAGNHRAP